MDYFVFKVYCIPLLSLFILMPKLFPILLGHWTAGCVIYFHYFPIKCDYFEEWYYLCPTTPSFSLPLFSLPVVTWLSVPAFGCIRCFFPLLHVELSLWSSLSPSCALDVDIGGFICSICWSLIFYMVQLVVRWLQLFDRKLEFLYFNSFYGFLRCEMSHFQMKFSFRQGNQ